MVHQKTDRIGRCIIEWCKLDRVLAPWLLALPGTSPTHIRLLLVQSVDNLLHILLSKLNLPLPLPSLEHLSPLPVQPEARLVRRIRLLADPLDSSSVDLLQLLRGRVCTSVFSSVEQRLKHRRRFESAFILDDNLLDLSRFGVLRPMR